MKIKYLIYGFLFTCFFSLHAEKKVLILGLDGCRDDAFEYAYQKIKEQQKYPFFTKLVEESLVAHHIYAGGHNYDITKQSTVSEPGWTTILTGVWANQHHIYFNNSLEKNKYNHDYPTLFNYVKKYIPSSRVAIFTDWSPISIIGQFSYFGGDNVDINRIYEYKNLEELESQHVIMLQDIASTMNAENSPTLIFVHFNNPDEMGHLFGFSTEVPEYINAIDKEISHIDQILQSVLVSEFNGNQWLVILTTDHGGHGNIHGLFSWDDKAIFTVIHATQDAHYQKSDVDAIQGQTTFLPTIFDYLGLPNEAYTKLAGKIITQAPKVSLYLTYDLNKNKPDSTPEPIQQIWPELKPYIEKIISIVPATENKYYIFLDDQTYLIYDPSSHWLDKPQSTTENWPGIGSEINKIVTFFYAPNNYFVILNNGRYLRYDQDRKLINSGYLAALWPGLESNLEKITAIVPIDNNQFLVFLNDGTYLNYNLNDRVYTQKSIAETWNGLNNLSKKIKIVFYSPTQKKYYFLLRAIPYD